MTNPFLQRLLDNYKLEIIFNLNKYIHKFTFGLILIFTQGFHEKDLMIMVRYCEGLFDLKCDDISIQRVFSVQMH